MREMEKRKEKEHKTARGLPGNTICPFPDSQTLLLVFVGSLFLHRRVCGTRFLVDIWSTPSELWVNSVRVDILGG